MNRIERKPEDLLKINCLGKSLSDFQIVYNEQSHKGEYFVALDLRYHLFYDTGCDFRVGFPCVFVLWRVLFFRRVGAKPRP